MKKKTITIGIIIVFVYIVYFLFNSLNKSLIFKTSGRYTYVIYNEKPFVISFNFTDKLHTYIELDNSEEIIVPGGYGKYRIGSLGKLAFLKKDYSIIDRAISNYISARINGSLIQNDGSIYEDLKDDTKINKNTLKQLFLIDHISNIPFFDRWYILSQILIYNRSANKLEKISKNQKDITGRLYDKVLRNDNKTIQIMYSSYNSASVLARIMDGSGARVVDMLSLDSPYDYSECEIIDSSDPVSITSQYMRDFFGCSLKRGKTQLSDIIIILNKKIEEKWDN